MAQDNGYSFVEVQEDGTKTICIDCWFEAQHGNGMSFDTRLKPDREAMWVHFQMHHSRMGHTTTNTCLAATGTTGLVVGQCLGRGNTTIIPVRGDYLIGLGVRSTNVVGLAGGSVTTRTITVHEVIDDCMSPQRTDSSEDETNPPATHGTRSPTSKSLTNAIYWNDALHWLETENRKLTHYRLDIEDHEHPIITTIRIPQRGMNFLKSYGYMDPMLILMQIPHLLHMEGKLFESYRVDTNDFMTPLPEGWLIQSTVCRIVLGEREEDSLLVINLSGKVVQYNLISKTLHDIFYCGSNQLDDNHDDDDDELLQQLEAEHNVYEFIPSFARV
ncbi:hypothetical protein Tco_1234854 [Tanacetum coccineum]